MAQQGQNRTVLIGRQFVKAFIGFPPKLKNEKAADLVSH
jgi:hypothetical protein